MVKHSSCLDPDEEPCSGLSHVEKVASQAVLVTSKFDLVFMDVVGTDSWLTHKLSHERVQLPLGAWQLEGSADGMDTVVFGYSGDSEGLVWDVDSQFTIQVLQAPDGTVILSKGGKYLDLGHEMVGHKLARCHVPVELGGNIPFEVGVFKMKRHGGLQVFWNLFDLHSRLAVVTQLPSKWIHKGMPQWKKAIEALVGSSEHFIMSSVGGSSIDKLPWCMRCLPWTATSSFGLLALLGRFCCHDRCLGGLQDFCV